MNIKKGDKVKILAGKDRGKTGAVVKVFPKERKVVVEGLNEVTRHFGPRRQGEKGQKVKMPAPLWASKVMLICPKCGAAVRVAYVFQGKTKLRQCRKCKETI